MREMRRQDRKITDPAMICAVLDKCRTLHLGLVEDGRAYIVPLNYGWTRRERALHSLRPQRC